MERIKNVLYILLLVLLCGGVLTCKKPTDLLDSLEDEVKQANDLYLEVLSITPQNNADSVDPGSTIQIEFDRDIDLTSIEALITLIDSETNPFASEVTGKTLDYSFNETNKVLSIAAEPYLDGLVEYTLQVLDGVKGTDGSQLREPLSVLFSTKDSPRGFIEIDQVYTNVTTVDVTLETQGATYYMLSSDQNFAGAGWTEITAGIMKLEDISIAGTAGANTLYAKFRDGTVDQAGSANVSVTETAVVIYDTIAPGISFDSPTVYSQGSTAAGVDAIVTDNQGNGAIASYLWEEVEGSTVSIDSTASKATNLRAGAGNDGSYTMRLTVTDKAGNSSSSDLVYICDSVPPSLDIGTEYNQKTNTNLNLTASADDPIGIASYEWAKVSGAGNVSFSDTDSASSTLRFSAVDTYYIKVTAYDNAGNASSRTVKVNCSEDEPVIKFGNSVYYASSGINVSATVENAGGSPTYEWTAGSGNISFNGQQATLTPLVTSTTDGKYSLTLKATNGSYSSESDVTFYWDTANPTVDIGSSIIYANASNLSPSIAGSVSDATSGIASYSWTKSSGTPSVSFSTPNSSSTKVNLNFDGDAVVRLTVTDKAGNSASDTRTVTRDTAAPGAPSLSVTSPTSDITPLVSLTPGSGGNVDYRYTVNSGSWSYFTSSSVSPALSYGGSILSFQGRDTAGNWSGSASKAVVVYPTKGPYPADGSTNVGRVDMAWPHQSGYYYRVYIGTSIRSLDLVGGYRSLPFVDSSELLFGINTTYYWYIDVYRKSGKIYQYVSSSSTYSFRTGFIK